MKVVISRELAEGLIEYLAQPLVAGGNFPLETHRAEADGVDELLVELQEAVSRPFSFRGLLRGGTKGAA